MRDSVKEVQYLNNKCLRKREGGQEGGGEENMKGIIPYSFPEVKNLRLRIERSHCECLG